MHRYVKNQFTPASTTSTVGASFLTKRVVDDESDTVVRLQIWDTAGQERFRYNNITLSLSPPKSLNLLKKMNPLQRLTGCKHNSSISRLYYRGANACILCYSITDTASFEEMGVWLTELRRNLSPDIILHVVGTKADLVAREPTKREVPFERCIAYVAENLAPGQSSTPPATATTPGGDIAGFKFLSGALADGARSPSSKRSSGFWGQEVGWDCCHEVSAESGEGVEEVFRVITRKLVEQNRKMKEQLSHAVGSPGIGAPGYEGSRSEGAYFEGMRPGGSFRLGRDRRSWFGVPVEVVISEGQESTPHTQQKVVRRKCC